MRYFVECDRNESTTFLTEKGISSVNNEEVEITTPVKPFTPPSEEEIRKILNNYRMLNTPMANQILSLWGAKNHE